MSLTFLYQLGNRTCEGSTLDIYRGLVVEKCDDVLDETKGVDEDELACLFRSGTVMDHFQMPLVWKFYQVLLLVRDKLFRHKRVVLQTCPRCSQGDEIILHQLVQCSGSTDLCSYVKQLLSQEGQIRLSAVSILRLIAPPSFNRAGKVFFYSSRKGSYP